MSKRIEVQHDGPGLPIVINPNTLEYAMREVECYEQRTGAHQFCHWITTARGAIAQAKEEG